MASPRSLIRAVAAEAPVVPQAKRKSQGTDAALPRAVEGGQPAPRRGTPKSLIKELASGRFADVPVASPLPAAPVSKRKLSLVQMTLSASPPEPARAAAGLTPLAKRKESMGSNASLGSPSLVADLSTPGSAKRSRLSSASPGAALLPNETPSPLSQRLSVASLLGEVVSPLAVVDAPPQRGTLTNVPRMRVDATLPFELPASVHHKKKATPVRSSKQPGGPQVGGAKNRQRARVSIPTSLLRKLAAAHTTLRIAPEAFKSMEGASEVFLEQLCGDLGAYAKHRKTKTLDKSDFECLLKRQKHGMNKTSLDDLLRRNLPAEYVDEVLPVAKAGNVLVPESI